jgi:hypothetical protein
MYKIGAISLVDGTSMWDIEDDDTKHMTGQAESKSDTNENHIRYESAEHGRKEWTNIARAQKCQMI